MSNCEKKESKFDGVSDIVLPLLAALSLILMIACLLLSEYAKQIRPDSNQHGCPKASGQKLNN